MARMRRSAEVGDPFDVSVPALLAGTYSRLVPQERVEGGEMAYAREVAPGLAEVLNLDLPTAVAFYGDEQVAQYGPLEDLWRAGRSNLRRVEPDAHRTLDREGGRVEVLTGDSMYLASTLLVLEDLVGRVSGAPPDRDLGVLAAVPHRHQLDYHVIRDESLLPSLNLLATFAAMGHSEGVGAISPDVYWWHHGRFERLTTLADGRIKVDATGEFGHVLEQVTGEPPVSPR